MKFIIKNKKGDLEIDEIGKLIIGLVLLIVLIAIVTIYIGGDLSDQSDSVVGAFDIFN